MQEMGILAELPTKGQKGTVAMNSVLRTKNPLVLLALLLGLVILASPSMADVKYWQTAGAGVWHDGANWGGTAPGPADQVFITNTSASVLLTNDTAFLGSLTLSKTLTFTNWTTELHATNVTIQSAGLMTLPDAFTGTQMSNRVWIVCTNLTVESGGSIDVDGAGFSGGAQNQAGHGPGGGSVGNYGGGGGYGGRGGWAFLAANGWKGSGGTSYGSASSSTAPGSGGGTFNSGSSYGGDGGGAVLIQAGGDVVVDGTLSANGTDANYFSGGGSGGGVSISCGRFDGAGLISVNGGAHANSGGGGGGGRIAIDYSSLIGTPTVRFESRQADGVMTRDDPRLRWVGEQWMADPGTLYLPNTDLLSQTITNIEAHVIVPSFVSWSPASLSISNAALTLDDGFALTVGGKLTIGPNGGLELGTNAYLSCGGDLVVDDGRLAINVLTQMVCSADLVLTNGGVLSLTSMATNGTPIHGALVSVTGDIRIGPSSWVYPNTHIVNGGALRFRAANVYVATGGGMNGDGRGYSGGVGPISGSTDGYGPGGGTKGSSSPNYGSGGGYGGQGGYSWNNTWGVSGGPAYGKTNAPVEPGSGGGNFLTTGLGGHGGGTLWIEASGKVVLDGTLTADGGPAHYYSGGGSGGGIFISTPSFSGNASGLFSVDGSDRANFGGPGGGGRIAVAIGLSDAARDSLISNGTLAGMNVYTSDTSFVGLITTGVGNGPDYTGEEWRAPKPGTVRFIITNMLLTVTGDPGPYGDPSPWAYGSNPYIDDNTWITNSVVSPADEAGGMRRACIGWELEDSGGGLVDSGVNTQVVFQLTATRVQRWLWTNEYELAMSSANPLNGFVRLDANGWYTNGLVVANLFATPSNGYMFSEWTGDFPPGHSADNPLTVTMDQARTIVGQFSEAGGSTKYWNGNGTWETAGSWTPSGMPGPYDHAIIESGNVLLSIPRGVMRLTVSNNATMTFTNWSTSLSASNFTILSSGLLTLPSAFTNSQMTNRVWIVCTNLTIEQGAAIDVSGRGFDGGRTSSDPGFGPGKGSGGAYGGGGGYGGRGGWGHLTTWRSAGGATYDSVSNATAPGSGGGAFSGASGRGGAGGGAVCIQAGGDVVVDGTIRADGTNGISYSGGGSGGGIAITCDRFGGSGGLIAANGGARDDYGGDGGGGRIAVIYSDLIATPSVRFEAIEADSILSRWDHKLRWSESRWVSEPGTLYFSDTNLLSGTITNLYGQLFIPGFDAWSPGDLTVSDGLVQLEPGFELTVANLTVGPSGTLELGADPQLNPTGNILLNDGRLVMNVFTQMTCAGSLVLTNGGEFRAYSAPTNGVKAHGCLVTVSGDIEVYPSSWIYPENARVNGGCVRFQAQNVVVHTNAGFDAVGRGFSGAFGPVSSHARGYGPGGGEKGTGYPVYGTGGGYGGKGGWGNHTGTWGTYGGVACGSSNAPVLPGSGGGCYGYGEGGHGGGTIWIEAATQITLDGTLKTHGGIAAYYSGGGSGGGIFVRAQTFRGGTDGLLAADGSDRTDAGGPGGGGRIAAAVGLSDSEYSDLLAGVPVAHLLHASTLSGFSGAMTVGVGAGPDYTGEEWRAPGEGTAQFLTSALARGTLILVR